MSVASITINRLHSRCIRTYSSFFKITPKIETQDEPVLSCLYIPGDKACKFVSVLKPNINYEKIFRNVETNLKHRKMKTDVDRLKNGLKELLKLQNEKDEIQKERHRLKECLKTHNDCRIDNDLEKLTEKWKRTSSSIYRLENDVIVPIFQLPNELHPKTPIEHDEKLFEFLSVPRFDFTPKSHVEIGRTKKEIVCADVSPTSYFLCKNAAIFELNSINYFTDLHESCKFIQLSNPDLCKPPLVEGCGYGFLDESKSFLLDTDEPGSGYHLVGGASLESFYGFHMRRSVARLNSLPLRYFCVGRRYDVNFDANLGLLKSLQSSRVNFFIAIENDDDKTDLEHGKMVELLTNEFKKLEIHFRVVNLSASKLNFTQRLKTSFQMWSPCSGEYIEIGYVGICADFISHRLLSQYETKHKTMYLNVVHGVSVNATRLLACIMENTQNSVGEWTMPKIFPNF